MSNERDKSENCFAMFVGMLVGGLFDEILYPTAEADNSSDSKSFVDPCCCEDLPTEDAEYHESVDSDLDLDCF